METNEQKLELVTETVIAIPFGGSDDESDFEDVDIDVEDYVEPECIFPCSIYTPSELAYRDIPGGPRLRMKIYQDAFGRCRNRVQEVLRSINSPTVKRIIDILQDAYEPHEEDRLMPYTELRAVAISGTDRSATSSVLDNVRCVLMESQFRRDKTETSGRRDELRMKTPVIVSTLAPTDCSNITTTMKTMITGFLESGLGDANDTEKGRDKRSLASYDIKLLEVWYAKLRQSRDEADLPKLVVLVTDLEKIEPTIMQDLFYICSLHIPCIPFVFILGLSTPPTPSYLHTTFPRKTLALLHLTRVEVAGGMDVLSRVLKDTFFYPGFEPTIMPSPTVLTFLAEQFTRSVQSIDFVMSLLQLVYLRHFADPISVLAQDELLGTSSIGEAAEKLSEPDGRPFLLTLLARLQHSEKVVPLTNGATDHDDTPEMSQNKARQKGKSNAINDDDSELKSALDALSSIRELRRSHNERLRRARVAFRVVCEVRTRLLEAGSIRVTKEDPGAGPVIGTEIDLMCLWLRGMAAEEEGYDLAKQMRRMDFAQLSRLPSGWYELLTNMPKEVIASEESMMGLLAEWREEVDVLQNESDSDDRDKRVSDFKKKICKWFPNHIRERTRDFTETELWDIWYTGNPTGLAEVFNPAPRVVIVNALMHPDRYLGNAETSPSRTSSPTKGKGKRSVGNTTGGADSEKLVPDTSMLFKGYIESGRMMNVYDWYMSFKEGLDARRRSERVADGPSRKNWRGKKDRQKPGKRVGRKEGSAPSSPTKRRGRGGGTLARGRGTRRAKLRPRYDLESGGSADEIESDAESEDDLSLEERERWEAEVQARFIRSVQELDLLGFIKHTGRKADHVQKIVYELPEYG